MAITATMSEAKALTAEFAEEAEMEAGVGGAGGNVGAAVRLTEVVLPASGWAGAGSPYWQVVELDCVTPRSLVDLQPSKEQLVIFQEQALSFVTENDSGVVTVYAMGEKPEADFTIQATVMEVIA